MFYEEEDSWVSGFWFRLFASVLLFSCSHWRVLLSTFRPLSSCFCLEPSSFVLFSAGAMVALVETEEEEDDDVPLIMRR